MDKRIFGDIENRWDIHLGIGDRVLLKNYINELIERGCSSIQEMNSYVRTYLTDMGYSSNELIILRDKQNKHETEFTNYILKRKGLPTLPIKNPRIN